MHLGEFYGSDIIWNATKDWILVSLNIISTTTCHLSTCLSFFTHVFYLCFSPYLSKHGTQHFHLIEEIHFTHHTFGITHGQLKIREICKESYYSLNPPPFDKILLPHQLLSLSFSSFSSIYNLPFMSKVVSHLLISFGVR